MNKRAGLEIDPANIIAEIKRRSEKRSRGGMEPIPKGFEPCRHSEHAPPTHICIPQGMQYRHICPGCGSEQVIRPMQVWL